MNNFIKKFKMHLGKISDFGNLVDIFNKVIFFQIIYCIMLTIYYILYQNGKSGFQPILYCSPLILLLFIEIFENFFDEIWKLVLGEIVVSLLLIKFIPLEGSRIIYVICCIFLCLKSIYRHRFKFSQSALYSERYRTQNRTRMFFSMMIIIFFIHILSSDKIVSNDLNSYYTCNYYMLASLAVFIISMIMNKYAFKYYEYYRHELKGDTQTNRQLVRSFILIFLTTIILITVVFLIFGDLLVPLLSKICSIIINFFVSVVWSIFNIDLVGDRKIGNGQMTSLYSNYPKQTKKIIINNSQIASAVPLLVVFIIIGAVLYLVWKIYKGILSNYKVGSDEVEFVPIRKDTTCYEEASKKTNKVTFGKNNRDKIRKYYYQVVLKKSKKYNIKVNLSDTTEEIKSLISHSRIEKELMSDLTNIYKKARYSEKEITEKEVQNAKNINEKI